MTFDTFKSWLPVIVIVFAAGGAWVAVTGRVDALAQAVEQMKSLPEQTQRLAEQTQYVSCVTIDRRPRDVCRCEIEEFRKPLEERNLRRCEWIEKRIFTGDTLSAAYRHVTGDTVEMPDR